MTRRAERDQILQSICQFVCIVDVRDIAEGTKRRDVVNIMLPILPLSRTAVTTDVAIARTRSTPLSGPVGAIVGRRWQYARLLHPRREILRERQPVPHRAQLLLWQVNGRPGQRLVGISFDLSVARSAGGDQELTIPSVHETLCILFVFETRENLFKNTYIGR